MTLPSPRQIGLLTMLPQPASFLTYLSLEAVEHLSACRDSGWAKQEGGMFRRTEMGEAAIKQACGEPI